ncbi:polysaccharide deacetylase family protein [Thermodesulfobacteriota bacterium]
MENTRYDYSPIILREPIKWPNNARVAVWVIPNIEHHQIDVPSVSLTPSQARPVPDVRNYGWLGFGNRVGIWRIMDVLDKYSIKATVALNSSVCDHYPVIVAEGRKRGWEFMGHGITNSQNLANLSEVAERRLIKTTIQTIADAVGKRPEGWLSPGLTETFNTPDILAEEGIKYVCDWCNDDQPYPMKVRNGTLISIPYTVEANDRPAFVNLHLTPQEFCQNVMDQFDVLYEEGVSRGMVMAIALHSYLSGQAFRIKYLDKALGYIAGHEHVWFATGTEIVKWYCERYLQSI